MDFGQATIDREFDKRFLFGINEFIKFVFPLFRDHFSTSLGRLMAL